MKWVVGIGVEILGEELIVFCVVLMLVLMKSVIELYEFVFKILNEREREWFWVGTSGMKFFEVGKLVIFWGEGKWVLVMVSDGNVILNVFWVDFVGMYYFLKFEIFEGSDVENFMFVFERCGDGSFVVGWFLLVKVSDV